MQINKLLDFFKTKNDARFRVLFDLIGEERLKPIVKRISQGHRLTGRISEYDALDSFVVAFPFLESDQSLPFRELRQILSFISLLEDLGSFFDKHQYAPQRRYTGHNNLGKRYSNFVSRHSDKEDRVLIVSRFLGLVSLPSPIPWDKSKRAPVLNRIHENSWTVNLANLIQYKSSNGSCFVPFHDVSNASLRRWCFRQLNLFNRGDLLEHRMTKLRELGFFECYGTQNTFSLAS